MSPLNASSTSPKNPSPLSGSPQNAPGLTDPSTADSAVQDVQVPIPDGAEFLELPLFPKPSSPPTSAQSSPLNLSSSRLSSSPNSNASNDSVTRRNRKRSFTPPPPTDSGPLPQLSPPSIAQAGRGRSDSVTVAQLSRRERRSEGSSPAGSRSPPRVKVNVIAPGTPLVGDAKINHTRLIITKTHTSYPALSSLIPFPSAILGFHVVFHTPSGYANQRVHNADMTIKFSPPAGSSLPDTDAPVVKAIYPSRSTFGSPETKVTWKVDNTLGISFGYSPYGSLNVGRTGSKTINTATTANFMASGLETTSILMTLAEDSVTKSGVPQSFDFACLLYLPSSNRPEPEGSKAFSCTLDVDATVGSGLSRLSTLWTGGERQFAMHFDGTTQLGRLEFGGVVQYEGGGRDPLQDDEAQEALSRSTPNLDASSSPPSGRRGGGGRGAIGYEVEEE